MSKSQRDKGKRFEREVVNTLKEHGFQAKRIPLSGSQEGFKGDIIFRKNDYSEELLGECKSRGSGFKLIYDSLEKDQADVLFIKQDRKDTLVVLSLENYIKTVS
tara:strand:+ start:1449 stop:1760 length:312 start_codon:yes stop_codon:yes gene_type:complete